MRSSACPAAPVVASGEFLIVGAGYVPVAADLRLPTRTVGKELTKNDNCVTTGAIREFLALVVRLNHRSKAVSPFMRLPAGPSIPGAVREKGESPPLIGIGVPAA